MSGNRTSSDVKQNGEFQEDRSEPVSPTMEEFEMEDEDGPLLSQLESSHRKKIRSCTPVVSMFSPSSRPRLLLIIAAAGFIGLSLVAVGVLLFAGVLFKSLLHNESPSSQTPSSNSTADSPLRHGNSTLLAMGHSYVKVIMTPEDTSFRRLECPSPSIDRYAYLRDPPSSKSKVPTPRSYFFALDLHQCVDVLPRLMGSIIESIRFLGPENCALSVVEGRSDDGTFEVLKLLIDKIEGMGARYFFTSSEINLGKDNNVHRISARWQNFAI